MKHNIFGILLMLTLILTTSACQKETTDQYTSRSSVVERVKRFVYDSQGDIILGKTDNFKHNEWIIGVTDSAKPLQIFGELTGTEVNLSRNYNHIFRSDDGTCIISIKGSLIANNKHEYAEMTVIIPGMEEIRTIHLVSEEYNDSLSRGSTSNRESGVPVIMGK